MLEGRFLKAIDSVLSLAGTASCHELGRHVRLSLRNELIPISQVTSGAGDNNRQLLVEAASAVFVFHAIYNLGTPESLQNK